MRVEGSMVYFKILVKHLVEGTEENHKNSYNTLSQNWDSNLVPPKYEAGVLTTRWLYVWLVQVEENQSQVQ
jgi:hypothetical protein